MRSDKGSEFVSEAILKWLSLTTQGGLKSEVQQPAMLKRSVDVA